MLLLEGGVEDDAWVLQIGFGSYQKNLHANSEDYDKARKFD